MVSARLQVHKSNLLIANDLYLFPIDKSSFVFSAFSCLAVLPYVLMVHAPMTAKQVLTLVAAGLFAAGGQFSVTAAYCCAPAKEISVYDYSQVIFSTLLGFFIFGDVPDGFSVLGYFLICGMAVLNFWNSNRPSLKSS